MIKKEIKKKKSINKWNFEVVCWFNVSVNVKYNQKVTLGVFHAREQAISYFFLSLFLSMI